MLSALLPAMLACHGQPPAQHGRLLLVLPFENHSSQNNLDWVTEAVPEVLNQRLGSAGFLPIGRSDRLYALDHLGLPLNFQPSRASTIRLAQTLDADYVVIGSYTVVGSRLKASARVLDISGLKLGPPIEVEAELVRLVDVFNRLAWRIARQLDPDYAVAEETFVAADATLRVDAFENYVRGLVESEAAERIKHLKEAVRLNPDFNPAWLALGRAYFADQQYELAAATFAKLPKTDPSAREAQFYRGLSYFYTGNYVKAEEAFAFVGTLLPLPEVVNDQGVAASRHGRDGGPMFEQAIAADPNDADYHFNLGVSLRRRGDFAGATREIEQSLKLHANDSEAQVFLASLKQGAAKNPTPAAPLKTSTATASVAETDNEAIPLERIKRSYNETSYRQAAFEIAQMQAMQLATMNPADRANALAKDGMQYLSRGLMLEAEREFQAAVQTDSANSAAHTGLAEVRERSGDADAARIEATTALRIQPSVAAYLVLARLDAQADKLGDAAQEVSSALKVDPGSSAARGMRQALEAKGQVVQ